MPQVKIPAVFMRGGTSNAVVFKQSDLPVDRSSWPQIFRAAMGSPDPFGRQLNGMGGGISSLSKVCVVGPPTRNDADIDYTFAQIGVRNDSVGFKTNCGNMSAAMGPFAVDEGLVSAPEGTAKVRIHNTNTNKIIVAHFDVDSGLAAVDGDYVMPGVADAGARVQLDFLEPGGAVTGQLLPTKNLVDTIEIEGFGAVEVSIIDAANPTVFVEAQAIGIDGTELPAELDSNSQVMHRLEILRRKAGVMAGIADTVEAMASLPSAMSPVVVRQPCDVQTLSGERVAARDGDLVARAVSSGNVHRALPGTRTICTAIACQIRGSIAYRCARPGKSDSAGTVDSRLVHPSGVTTVGATVAERNGEWHASSGTLYRTQRRLFEGKVCIPAARVPSLVALANAAD